MAITLATFHDGRSRSGSIRARRAAVAAAGALLAAATACLPAGGQRSYGVSPRLAQERPRRVGLLVSRVATERFHQPTEITSDFDYARTKAGDGDVYVEEEERLRRAVPEYPEMPCHVALTFNNCAWKQAMFANITPRVQATVSGVLQAKGYQVQDMRAVARAWPTPIREMRVGDMVSRARGAVDAVFVFHYRDIGEYAIGTKWTGGGAGSGFTRLDYEGALFDTGTGERLVAFGGRGISVPHALAADSTLREKVSANGDAVTVKLSQDEVVDRTLAYVRDGVTYKTKAGEQRVEGLVTLIP